MQQKRPDGKPAGCSLVLKAALLLTVLATSAQGTPDGAHACFLFVSANEMMHDPAAVHVCGIYDYQTC